MYNIHACIEWTCDKYTAQLFSQHEHSHVNGTQIKKEDMPSDPEALFCPFLLTEALSTKGNH